MLEFVCKAKQQFVTGCYINKSRNETKAPPTNLCIPVSVHLTCSGCLPVLLVRKDYTLLLCAFIVVILVEG